MGVHRCHWCQLNPKACLEKAFRYCLVSRSQSPAGNAILEAPPRLPCWRQSRQEQHFQPRGWKRDWKRLLA
ncbi:hypothetical protein HUN01_25580 [Nostoc edaphicum CCNP1411]|uniref:Uncharacterized protein n=1 Tax=Nostoc edaphicum CCNP1411 TaxID=1472755 RepID=A0A7D7LJJ5_9NOSO|nr:hypothetical protein [Nostoc edaphicum]QMS90787.1 hypothetical protein HUN01_25580 [Nostoc edaphicum CCNP1411]